MTTDNGYLSAFAVFLIYFLMCALRAIRRRRPTTRHPYNQPLKRL